MKHPFKSHILPWFPLGTGVLGLALRFLLFSATDEKGLLPVGHFADPALYLLTALTLGILFLATRELTPGKNLNRIWGAVACTLSALGLGYTAIMDFSFGTVRLATVAAAAGILGSLVLLAMAALYLSGKKTPYWLYAIFTVTLMLDTVAQCQVWGSEPQLQAYFFPLLASIFLILTGYQAAAVAAGQGKPKLLAFFSQGAVFLCCVSLNNPQWPLYLGMLFWAAVQFYPCILRNKEA